MINKLCRNVPIGGVVFCLIPIFISIRPSYEIERYLPVIHRLSQIDWVGSSVFTGAFVCLFLALQWGGQTKPWNSSEVIGLIIGTVLLLGVFGWIQQCTGERALIPLRLLKQRTVLFGSIYLLLSYLALSIVSYLFSEDRYLLRRSAVLVLPSNILSSYPRCLRNE